MVGMFMIGRPFPVMRDFLVYAASAGSPLYGAGVMAVQGLGQIAVMALLFLALAYGTGRRMSAWLSSVPGRGSLVTGLSLVAGGTFFIFYWGLAFAYGIGRWGFKLGWYS
jgi:cytochrome c biogenesis protein CcdA